MEFISSSNHGNRNQDRDVTAKIASLSATLARQNPVAGKALLKLEGKPKTRLNSEERKAVATLEGAATKLFGETKDRSWHAVAKHFRRLLNGASQSQSNGSAIPNTKNL